MVSKIVNEQDLFLEQEPEITYIVYKNATRQLPEKNQNSTNAPILLIMAANSVVIIKPTAQEVVNATECF
ncbi:hypothetical protein KGM_201703 [Danaus plexippus plexippus]|uniref:Uncharacterized protein n=1 Tax=Danaus plexippus plexippus TaxID=278856 RepID=A0A212EIK2_DANPL|nr:hypothetical protein KGM_201703 [Danaus plexippus plexippus]